MVEGSDAEVARQLAFYEGSVRVGEQEHEKDENEDSHGFVGDHSKDVCHSVQAEFGEEISF